MCYYLGIEVKKETFIHLKDLQVQVKEHDLIRPVMSGFEYDSWPILIPAANGQSLELILAHWELIPNWINSREELAASRKKFTTLNATAERLLESRVYQAAALKRRCLILASGFYEWRHLSLPGKKKPVAYPYRKRPSLLFCCRHLAKLDRPGDRRNNAHIYTGYDCCKPPHVSHPQYQKTHADHFAGSESL